MPQISFNFQALSLTPASQDSNVSVAKLPSAFTPVMSDKPGIEAIFEGLRLANIEGFIVPTCSRLTKNVDR
jgi:hypothetical protein